VLSKKNAAAYFKPSKEIKRFADNQLGEVGQGYQNIKHGSRSFGKRTWIANMSKKQSNLLAVPALERFVP
jgi:hypothetical protein